MYARAPTTPALWGPRTCPALLAHAFRRPRVQAERVRPCGRASLDHCLEEAGRGQFFSATSAWTPGLGG